VDNLFDLEPEPPEEDKVTSLIMDDVPHDLIRAPLALALHPENTASPPHQQLAATGGGASPQLNTPVPATDTGTAPSPSDPPVGNFINLEPEPPEKDKVTSLIMDDVPHVIRPPLHPTTTGSPPHQQLAAIGGGASHISPDSHRRRVQTSSMVRRSDSTEKANLSTSSSVSYSSGVSSVIRGLPKTVISSLSIEDEVISCRWCGGQLRHGEEFCSQFCAVKYWGRLRRQNGKASGTY
jgi:hypothetical protein